MQTLIKIQYKCRSCGVAFTDQVVALPEHYRTSDVGLRTHARDANTVTLLPKQTRIPLTAPHYCLPVVFSIGDFLHIEIIRDEASTGE